MKWLNGVTWIIAVGFLIACSSMPSVTRTGQMQPVLIEEEISPTQVTVSPGDEIRWTNRRQGPVRIIFLQPVKDMISCSDGFNGNATRLEPNESASLCFSKPGPMKYIVRGESTLPTGEINIPGSIRVEDPSDLASR
jgi:uncharacterized cupredoxin-like copper-binding protein